MATPVIMPRQGQSVESCIISEWFVQKGDPVKEGDLLFSYETDKAAFEEEAKASGTILEIFFKQGEDVPVLTNICVIGELGEDYGSFIPAGASAKPAQEDKKNEMELQAAAEAGGEATIGTAAKNGNKATIAGVGHRSETATPTQAKTIETTTSVAAGERFISPRARNLADSIGVDIRQAIPTGPNSRIIERDVRNLQQQGALVTSGAKDAYDNVAQPVSGTGLGGRVTTQDMKRPMPVEPGTVEQRVPAAEYQDMKVSNIRKVIARTMQESLSQMAQLTLNASFDATDILSFRKRLKADGEKIGLSNITLNDILIYATSRILPLHKSINAHFMGETMRFFTNVNMGVAVDTDRGLMVPTLFNANLKSLNEISIEAKQLAQECQKGTINPDKLKNGTFTITNLGALGIESFTPVINPPQTAILGVNTIESRCRERNGVLEAYSSMSLSLTFDHRAVDGAPAARFLKDLREALESFTLLLAKQEPLSYDK